MWRKPLVSRNKGAARLALYGAVVLLAGAWLFHYLSFDPWIDIDDSWRHVDWESYESVRLLQEYLRIDTSYPQGSEVPGAEFLASQLEAAGIPYTLERLGNRNANLWAVLEGKDRRALVLHNHIDVDPIRSPERWRHPPFSGAIDPPWIFGRGAFDMKSVTIAQLMAFTELKRSGAPLERSVIFLATGDEETESWLGTRWLLQHHPELVERFDVVLTEGGAVEATKTDTVTYWGTEFAQKRFVEIEACHSSKERLEQLSEDALEHQLNNTVWKVTDTAREFFDTYAASRRMPHERRALRSPEEEEDEYPYLAAYLQAMLRNELHPFPVVENEDGGYRMRLSLHLLPGEELEVAMAELLPEWMTLGVPLRIDVPHEISPSSPSDHPLFEVIGQLLEQRLPGVRNGPLFVPWAATDARFFRAAGISSYGFSPFLILSVDTYQMTGANERMALPPYVDGVELYIDMVRDLAALPLHSD